jgi:phosphatidylglycerophosphatase A
VAPGTAGSVGALPLCWLAATYFPLWGRIAFAAAVTIIGILGAAQDQYEGGKGDPQYIVVDEVAGMLWTTLLSTPSWLPLLVGFGLFRLFDVLKPPPANIFDRMSKKSKSAFWRGAHIVLDDVIAGFYALAVLLLLGLFGAWFAANFPPLYA